MPVYEAITPPSSVACARCGESALYGSGHPHLYNTIMLIGLCFECADFANQNVDYEDHRFNVRIVPRSVRFFTRCAFWFCPRYAIFWENPATTQHPYCVCHLSEGIEDEQRYPEPDYSQVEGGQQTHPNAHIAPIDVDAEPEVITVGSQSVIEVSSGSEFETTQEV